MDRLVAGFGMSYLDVVYKNSSFSPGDYAHQLVDHLVEVELDQDLRKLASTRHLRLLDVGCGKGFQAAAFAAYFRVSCLDRSDDYASLFDELGLEVQGRTCDLDRDQYPFENSSFDVIYSKSVIEHLRDWEHYLGEVHRLLDDEGHLVIMTPSWRKQRDNFYDDPTHIHPFTHRGLRSALDIAGFKDVTVREFYQLPFVWRHRYLGWVPRLVALLPDFMKWTDAARTRQRVLVRFSKETMLLAVARK